MPTQELLLTGGFGIEVAIEFGEIERNYGKSYSTVLRTGHTDGDLSFKLTYDILANSGGQAITDPEDSIAKAPARYVWEFFVRRKQDGAAFNVKDPRTGNLVLVKFAEKKLSYTLFAVRLFSSGITLKQFRNLT